MEKRKLGTTDLAVSRIGLGCVTFGREIDEAASFAVMDYALAHGVTLFDTAEAYGGGQARAYRRDIFGIDDIRETSGEFHSSEKIIGRWLKARGCRDRIVLQTKVATDSSRAHIAAALDASLQRLQTDYVNLYLFHSYDAETPLEEALEAMTAVVRSGKVRVAGCSNFSAPQLQASLDIGREMDLTRLAVIQPNYSLVCREIEVDLLPVCRREQIAVITYSPLGAGFLSGKYSPDRSTLPKGSRFDVIEGHADVYFSDRNFMVVERLRTKAATLGVPMVQLALGWVLQHPDVTSVLIGARTTEHIDNALGALEMQFADTLYQDMNAW